MKILKIIVFLMLTIFISGFGFNNQGYGFEKESGIIFDSYGKGPKLIFADGHSRLELKSYLGLDPLENQTFLVSFKLKLHSLPQIGNRQNLLTKYVNDKKPHPGWAIAVSRFNTGSRFQVYWKDFKGRGGWYVFDNVSLVRNREYNLSLIASVDGILGLYFQPTPVADDETEGLFDSETKTVEINTDANFLGGFDVSQVKLTTNDYSLTIGDRQIGERAFRGEISEVLIANISKEFVDYKEALDFVEGGSNSIVERISANEVSLWLGELTREMLVEKSLDVGNVQIIQ
jgi:hypothetical protein